MTVRRESSSAGSTTWGQECFVRERREYLVCLVAASIIFPAYYVADVWMEPGLGTVFEVLRGLASLVLLAAALGVQGAHKLGHARALFVVALGLSGALVAAMLPRVEHYSVYLMGYSMYFWGTFLLSWPVWLAVSMYGWHLATVATAFLLTSGPRTQADYLFAALFLTSAAGLTGLSSYARRAAHAREFEVSSALAERNHELAKALTDLRLAQARLVAQEKLSALGRMLAGLSHEMSNPVNVLLNNLDPIREHFDTVRELLDQTRSGAINGGEALEAACEERELDWCDADFRDALEGMRQAGERVCQVNADLRAFIRADALGAKSVNLGDGLRATVALISRNVPRNVTLALEADEIPAFLGHPGQLNQVWLNLIQNAIDAVGAEGNVRVRSSVSRDCVCIAVADDGPGVDPEFRPRLFEPFATTKSVARATGLGLATSHDIVQRHGGRLYLDESHSPGARFVVELPLAS